MTKLTAIFGLLVACVMGAQVTETVPYTKGLQGDLLADIYRPAASAKPLPAVIFIHGGGWTEGTREQLKPVILAVQKAGYFGMAIDYDLVPQGAHFPVPLDESWQAVKWLRSHAKQYGIDPKRIAVIGSSAGGELTAEVGLGVNRPADVQPVAAAVIYNGVLDLTTFHDVKVTVNNYIGVPCTQKLANCQKSSPIYNVHAGAPPFYVGHGTADQTIPYEQAVAFVAKLKAAGVKTETFVAEGGPHTYWSHEEWKAANIEKTLVFLGDVLK